MVDVDMHKNYLLCGEVFKPRLSSKDKYIVKCSTCEDIFLLFDTFILHVAQDNCKQVEEPFEAAEEKSNNAADEERVEEYVELELDPLVVIKEELYQNEQSTTKKDSKEDSEVSLHSPENSVINSSGSEEDYEDSANESDHEYAEEKCVKSKERSTLSSASTFANKFMKSKSNVLVLIEAYKQQKPLWNKRTPIRLKEHREKCLEMATQEINSKLKLDLQWKQVSTLIVHLCRKYREELKLLKESQEKSIEYKPTWLFEHMQFLRPFMENNYIAKLDPDLPALLPDQIVKIFHIYESLPHLWNTSLIEHRCKNKRREAESEMLKAIENKLNLKINLECLKKYLHNIHVYFSQAKRNRIQKTDNSKEDIEGYYQYISFLYDHVGPFKCPECEQQFQSPFRFKIHKSQHDGSLPFTCSLCGLAIGKMLAYDFHARRHMEDFEDVCKECGRQFLHADALRIHMRNHTGVKPYCCDVCGVSFRHIQSFQCHKRKHEKRYLHTCDICSKGFYTKAKLNDHMKTHTNVRDCICNTCGKAFKTLNSLRTHEAIHRDDRKYVCSICGKAFKITNGLTQHMKTHGAKLHDEKSSNISKF